MIPDWQKKNVFVSSVLAEKYTSDFQKIKEILNKHSVECRFIHQTKDIWARDYMPIQVGLDKFVQFRYEPKYLDGFDDLRTIPSEIEMLKDYTIESSSINMDGGNVVCSKDKVILTNRVFKENPGLSKNEVQTELERIFDSEVYFVSDLDEKDDMTGHIDGHLRFVNNETIVVNRLADEETFWQRSFHEMIAASGLRYVEMPWFTPSLKTSKQSAIGSYVNYLHLDDLIIFPVFDCKGNKDAEALKVIHNLFPNHNIESVVINDIAEEGGLMNCITWTY